jgi:hypothetical protein
MANDTEKKRQTNLMLSPVTHLKLKVYAAHMRMSMGDLVWYLLERHYPFNSALENEMDFAEGVRLDGYE